MTTATLTAFLQMVMSLGEAWALAWPPLDRPPVVGKHWSRVTASHGEAGGLSRAEQGGRHAVWPRDYRRSSPGDAWPRGRPVEHRRWRLETRRWDCIGRTDWNLVCR